MRELILACINLMLQLVIFIAIGSILIQKMKLKIDVSMALVLGYIFYFTVFGGLMIPLTLLWVPLSIASYIWMVCLAVAVLCSLWMYRASLFSSIRMIWDILKEHGIFLFLALFVVGIQCLLVVFYQDTTVDAAYYVGQVSTSVYTDAMQRFDPYTGEMLQKFSARYVFSTYPMHNAVWCKLTGIHALVQSKVVMGVMNVLTANAVIYQIGKRLFDEDKKKADCMICFAAVMQLFSYTIYTPGTFFFTRIYEGKAILSNISFVLIFYCAIWIWQNVNDRRMWLVLFLTNASAVTFSGSSIIMPAAASAAVLPVLLWKKQWKQFLYYFLAILPSVLYAVVYVGARTGMFVFRAS